MNVTNYINRNVCVAIGILAYMLPQKAKAQTTTQNFIKKTSPISAVSTEANLNALNTSFKVESISYLDGLGRTLQDVVIKGSPVGNDIVQPYFYDTHGRQSSQLLPYVDATMTGTYRDQAFNAQPVFYTNQTMVAKTTKPYSELVFDGSPLNTVKEKSAPDTDWQLGNGHTTKTETSTNGDYDILFWYKTTGGDYSLDAVNHDYYYDADALTVTKLTDPNGSYSYVYTDKKGNTLCTKQFLEMRSGLPFYLTTYLVYDDFGQLTCVIPPKAMELMDASGNYSVNALTQDLVYKYTYDARHRLIEKRVPGTGWSYIVYNQLNQPVMLRDANLEAQHKWNFIKYDVLGRPVMSGLLDATSLPNYVDRATAQLQFDANQTAIGESEVPEDVNNPFGYTNVTLPTNLSAMTVLTVNYYDDYDFNNDGTPDYTFNNGAIPCLAFDYSNLTAIDGNVQSFITKNTTVGTSVSSASSFANKDKNAKMVDALKNCSAEISALSSIMAGNLSLSHSLLSIEDPSVLSSLKTSFSGPATDHLTALQADVAQCITLDNGSDPSLTSLLTSISSQCGNLTENINSTVYLIVAVQSSCQPYTNVLTARTRGYLTGSRVKVLDASNPVQWETVAVFYDDDGQRIQSQSNDHMGGTDLTNMVYDFTGNVIHTQQAHTLSGTTIQVLNHMSFDKMGRPTRVDQRNNMDLPVMLTNYAYNELSQLIDKKVHSLNVGASFLQSMDYRYNVHGELTSINNIDLSSDMGTNPASGTNDDTNDLWGMQLNYNTNTAGIYGTAQFSGNVSEKKWRSVTEATKRAYGYTYDKADRLQASGYAEYNGTAWATPSAGSPNYSEDNITYDANGNIKTLQRKGYISAGSGSYNVIDNLTYQYSGNFLTAVTDASPANGSLDFKDNGHTGSNEYTYDGNGNITSDLNKGITSITYNHLNLPKLITFNTAGTIAYTYDAAGTRLRKVVTQGSSVTTKNYAGIFEYVYNTGTGDVLESFHTQEGRCILNPNTGPQYRYEYQYTDNTGNVVMAFSDADFNNTITTSTEILQQNLYYSFGMRMEGTNVTILPVASKYKFSGMEFDDELNLNQYDFGARLYDPAIARWTCIDPMAEAAPHWTPFRYAYNNPVTVTDYSGMLEGGTDWENENETSAIDAVRKNVVAASSSTLLKTDPFSKKKYDVGNPDEKNTTLDPPGYQELGQEEAGEFLDQFAGGHYDINQDDDKGDPKSKVKDDSPSILNSYRGREDAWMLARGGVVSTADADATIGQKTAVLGIFAGGIIAPILIESAPLLLAFDKSGYKFLTKTSLARSGPIIKSVGAASRAEMLAKRLKLNINSPTTRQVLNSLDDTVESFISKFRKPSIRSELPGQFLKNTVEEALKSGNTTIRKLLIDNRFVK